MNKIKEICALNQKDDEALTKKDLILQWFSFFKNPITNISPLKTTNIYEIYQLIKGDKYREITNGLRSIKDSTEARVYKTRSFDYACFSGVFEKRSNDFLQTHSGLMVIDFDHLENAEAIKDLLIVDKYLETELLFISPSGDGLKWIVNIDIKKSTHQEYFIGIRNYLKSIYGLDVDVSGKDIARACFLPHDKDVFINPKYANHV